MEWEKPEHPRGNERHLLCPDLAQLIQEGTDRRVPEPAGRRVKRSQPSFEVPAGSE